MKLFLVKNFYSIIMIFFVGFMTLPFPTSPIQISWITFGTVNIPATLIAFKVLLPKYMKQFRRDVLEYVLVCGTISAVNLSLLYAITYYGSNLNMEAARSAVTLFIAFLGTLIFWNIMGVELSEPRTLIEHWRVTLTGLALCAVTMIAPFMLPDLFKFVPPTPLGWALIISIFLLTVVMVHTFTRNRYLIGQVWELVKP
jgi:magnesium-transporting ATPase (P-type)